MKIYIHGLKSKIMHIKEMSAVDIKAISEFYSQFTYMIQNSVFRFNRIFNQVHDKIDFKDLTAIQQLLSKYAKPSKRQESEDSRRTRRIVHNPVKQHTSSSFHKNRSQLKKQATTNQTNEFQVDLQKKASPEFHIDDIDEPRTAISAGAGLANEDISSEL